MREVKQNVYLFNELDEEIQNKIMENEMEFWMERRNQDFCRDFILELNDVGFSELEPLYSLGYCQGDGCCVEGNINIGEILEKNEDIKKQFSDSEIRRLNYIETSMWYSLKAIHSGNYYNIHYMHINSDVDGYYWMRDRELLEEVMEKLENVIEEYLDEFCKHMESVGYEMIYDRDGLREWLEESDDEYYEDGRQYWE